MNVLNVAKRSARGQPLDYICESIQEKNHMSVLNVGRPSVGNPGSVSIREFTWGKSPENAASQDCGKPFHPNPSCGGETARRY